MSKLLDVKKEIHYLEFANKERGFEHPTYSSDMELYELLRDGREETMEVAIRNFAPEIQGRISDNPVTNVRYLFVASVTLACRTAISAGVNHQDAYSASDVFIRRMDKMTGIDEIIALNTEMMEYYLKAIKNAKKEHIYSLPVRKCQDYIFNHLNEQITVEILADEVKLNPSYLSTLFKKEMQLSISEYIRKQRIEFACNMLRYSDYTYSEIAATLAFSSQSHFIKVFKEETGTTPKEYRNKA